MGHTVLCRHAAAFTTHGGTAMGPRRRMLYCALAGMVLGVLSFGAHEWGLTTRWEYVVSDLLFHTRAASRGPGDVVVVGITRECMEDPALGAPPWPRRTYARAITNLSAAGASVICLDIFFPMASSGSPDGVDDDAVLAAAIKDAGNVVLPVFDKLRGGERGVVDLQESLPSIRQAAAAIGHINVLPDPDGIVRRCPLRVGTLRRSYTQLGVVGAGLHLNRRRHTGRPVPADGDGAFRVPWRPATAWREGVNLVAFDDAYHGRLSPRQIAGKVVFIGQTAPGLPNADIINSPFGARFGLFCQADIAQGVVSGDYIRPWGDGLHLGLLLLLGAALGALMSTVRLGPIVLGSLALLAAETAASLMLFRSRGILIELVPSYLTVTLALLGSLAFGLAHKAREAHRWAQAMEVLRTSGFDPGRPEPADEPHGPAEALGIAGSLATTLQVPEATPHTVLGVLAGALGARYAFLRFEGNDGLPRWIAAAGGGTPEPRVRELAEAQARLEAERGPSMVVRDLRREATLSEFASIASSALVLRLMLGERTLGTVVLCDKEPTAIAPSRRFGIDDLRVALALAPQASLLLDHARLHRGLYTALRDACATLASAMSARDEYTSGHSLRVAHYSVFLARRLELPDWCVEAVELGALLHDIGKIGMREVILQGASRLTDEEVELVRQHPGTGASIFAHMDELQALLPAIRHHHERYDGGGYPDGLVGDQTALLARIVGLADAFDAMTFRRPYRDRALTFEEACEELTRNAGGQFDPDLARLFVEHATPELIRQAREGDRQPVMGLDPPDAEARELIAALGLGEDDRPR